MQPGARRLRVIGIVALLIIAGYASVRLYVSTHHARDSVTQARAAIIRVRADLVAGRNANADMHDARRDADHARSLTHDPVWDVASWLPPAHSVRRLTEIVDTLSRDALPPLIRVGPSINPSKLRTGPHQVAIAPLQAAAPSIVAADNALVAARDETAGLPGGWFGAIDDNRNRLLSDLDAFAGSLDDAARLVQVGPSMLGDHGLRRYFVGIQNNAETHATGGLVAAYAIITIDHGRVRVVERGNDSRLLVAARSVTGLGRRYYREYGHSSTRHWTTSNISPNFPSAARIWAKLWEAQRGQHIDGAFGVDPVALGSLLRVVGPVRIHGYSKTFTSSNLAPFIESGEYAAFSINQATLRKDFVSRVAGAILDRLLSGAGSTSELVHTLGEAAGAGHLQLWSSHPKDEIGLSGTPLAGELSPTTGPFAAVTFNDVVGSKLDYYLRRRLTYRANGCAGDRAATISVRMLNTAPRRGLPDYVMIRNDIRPGYVEHVANERLNVRVFASDGDLLTRATLAGRRVKLSRGIEHGHPVYTRGITLHPGTPTTLTLHLKEPPMFGAASTKVQPMHYAQSTELAVPAC